MTRVLSRLAGHRLGRADLHAVVDPRPGHRPRRLGSRAAKDRACRRVRRARRAAAACGRPRLPAAAIGIAYAVTDEVHQAFVPDGRAPCWTCSSTPSACCSASTSSGERRAESSCDHRAIVVDLDAVLGDTEPLWRPGWRTRSAAIVSSSMTIPTRPPWTPPSATGAHCSKRFAEDHARVYLRPDATANAELRRLTAAGIRVGAFTPRPEPLARVAAAHLGVARRLERSRRGRAPSTGCSMHSAATPSSSARPWPQSSSARGGRCRLRARRGRARLAPSPNDERRLLTSKGSRRTLAALPSTTRKLHTLPSSSRRRSTGRPPPARLPR